MAKIHLIPALVLLALTGPGNSWGASGVLHTFKQKPSGFRPLAPLVEDSLGNLYGTTAYGGLKGPACDIGEGGCGTVFMQAPNGTGGFKFSQIYTFQGQPDGSVPIGGLILDNAGNLYGTTWYGGANGNGAVFELSPVSGHGWTEKVLYSFGASPDALRPTGSLVFDASGNLYGASQFGGVQGYGTVFKLSPDGSGGWTESVLHSFYSSPGGSDGYYPAGPLLIDASENVYGSAYSGGLPAGFGVIFKLSPGAGTWTETVLYSFTDGNDGSGPVDLKFDASGNIYGTTQFGGGIGYQGTVFKLIPSMSNWTLQTLYAFNYDAGDGGIPTGVVLDSSGNIYGSTVQGGAQNWGIVYKLTPTRNGTWIEHLLHTFSGGTDGGSPQPIIFGPNGDLYGVTSFGGVLSGYDGFGVVYEQLP